MTELIVGALIMLVGTTSGFIMAKKGKQGERGPQGPAGPMGPMGMKGKDAE